MKQTHTLAHKDKQTHIRFYIHRLKIKVFFTVNSGVKFKYSQFLVFIQLDVKNGPFLNIYNEKTYGSQNLTV